MAMSIACEAEKNY